MKKTFSILLLWLCAIGTFAQHPTFLGVSMGEMYTKIDSELSRRHFRYVGITEQYGYIFVQKYKGTFATVQDCEVAILYSGFTAKPIVITVSFPASTDSTSTVHFYNTVLESLKEKYGEPQITTKESELLFHDSNKLAKFSDGAVRLSISGIKNHYYPYLEYLDEPNSKEHQRRVRWHEEDEAKHNSSLDDL